MASATVMETGDRIVSQPGLLTSQNKFSANPVVARLSSDSEDSELIFMDDDCRRDYCRLQTETIARKKYLVKERMRELENDLGYPYCT